MFFSVYTLGCKLNQLETEAITDSFCRERFAFMSGPPEQSSAEPDSGEPWICIVNTCTVTSMAEQKARRFIRKMLRQYPRACLIITGCYAQLDQAALSALEGEHGSARLFVVPGEQKDRLMDLPRFLAEAGAGPELPDLVASWLASLSNAAGTPAQNDGAFRFTPQRFASHSRAFLKIQDGCDRRCAYCRVSLARGKSRSLGAEKALAELKSLESQGFAEAVLTGVNIVQYRDMERDLAGLLEFLLSKTETIRLRLSSIEPDGLSDKFIQVLANNRIRPHFHLSLQSASAGILAKMGRPYTPAGVEKTVSLLRSVRRDPFLACDIIAGFPGETGAEFEKTFAFCQKIGFAWIHAFPFSRRPGTAAYDFPERVSERDAVKRVQRLTELGRKGRQEYLGRWEGREVEAVIEAKKALAKGFAAGVSENYLKLRVSCGNGAVPAAGELIRCRILSRAETGPFDALAEKLSETN